jgi:hypothetical protein
VLDIKNKCSLSKWLLKILIEEGTWQELIQNKYIKDKTLTRVQVKPTNSPFWKGIMVGRDKFFIEVLSSLGMEKILVSRKIRGWGRRHYHLNILLYIILLGTNMLELLMCCPLLL